MALALVSFLAAPVRAHAAETPPDSVARAAPAPPPADSLAGGGVITVGRVTPSKRDTARAGFFDQPRWVMARSLVVPGWGQLHNRAWLKAAAVAASESYLIVNVWKDGRSLRDLDREVSAARAADDFEAERAAVDRYNARLDRYVGRQWLLAGLVTYALVDAYVDAHFVKFKFEFEHDPALPEGVSGARLSVETRF